MSAHTLEIVQSLILISAANGAPVLAARALRARRRPLAAHWDCADRPPLPPQIPGAEIESSPAPQAARACRVFGRARGAGIRADGVRSPSGQVLERAKGIEPSYEAWEAQFIGLPRLSQGFLTKSLS